MYFLGLASYVFIRISSSFKALTTITICNAKFRKIRSILVQLHEVFAHDLKWFTLHTFLKE